jgi:hypothetical protein
MLTIAKRLVEKKLLKQQWANFIVAWSSSTIIEVGDRCHCNFKADMQASLGSTTPTKKKPPTMSQGLNASQKESCNILATTSDT